jgi:TonB family protein
MRRTWLLACAIACGPAPHPIVPAPRPVTARLPPPPPIVDLDAPDVPYRATVALQLQPGWGQFLDDCRLRLPRTHPLNATTLAATVELAVDADGHVVDVHLASSGNADYDRAVRQVIEDAAPLPRPPRALWADDDLVHLRWLFARDRRQAGPATAGVVPHDLPVRSVVARLLAGGDLARAARRIRREPASSERDAATQALMVQTLREALASTDATVRRAAVVAIGRAGMRELAAAVRDLLATSSDVELRIVALDAAARLADRAAVSVALDQLRDDVVVNRRLAGAEVRALVALGAGADAASVLRDHLDGAAAPEPTVLHVLAGLSVPELGTRLVRWQAATDPRVRAAACSALSAAPGGDAATAIVRGLRDRDATVRASCVEAIARRVADARPALTRIRELASDRDALVRAHAIAALGVLDPASLAVAPRASRGGASAARGDDRPSGGASAPRAGDRSSRRDGGSSAPGIDRSSDESAEVRAAYALALAAVAAASGEGATLAETRVRTLVDDRDADVRAAAWRAWLALPTGADTHAARAAQALRAATDSAPQVRTASLAALDDDAMLTRLATTDDDPQTRTEALVTLAQRRGRGATAEHLLQRLADATPGSAERVRTALAWLLAR